MRDDLTRLFDHVAELLAWRADGLTRPGDGLEAFKEPRRLALTKMREQFRPAHALEGGRETCRGRVGQRAVPIPPAERSAFATSSHRNVDAPPRLKQGRAETDPPAQRTLDFSGDAHSTEN
jgi:hypothetical protein